MLRSCPLRTLSHRLATIFLLVCADLTNTSGARAAGEARAHLVVEVAPEVRGCPAPEAIAQSIAVRLGYDPFRGEGGHVLRIAFRASGRHLIADVQMARGEDRLERSRASDKGDCSELAEAASLTAATLLDPRAVFSAKQVKAPVSSVVVVHESPAASPWYAPQAAEVPAAPPRPEAIWRIRVGASATTCMGCAKAATVGFGPVIGVVRDRWGVDLMGRWDMPISTLQPDGTGVRSSLLLFRAFPHVRAGVFRVGPIFEVGALLGEAVGVGHGPTRDRSPWLGAGARGAFEYPLSTWLSAHAAVDGTFLASRVRLRVGEAELWRSGILSGGLSGGLVATF